MLISVTGRESCACYHTHAAHASPCICLTCMKELRRLLCTTRRAGVHTMFLHSPLCLPHTCVPCMGFMHGNVRSMQGAACLVNAQPACMRFIALQQHPVVGLVTIHAGTYLTWVTTTIILGRFLWSAILKPKLDELAGKQCTFVSRIRSPQQYAQYPQQCAVHIALYCRLLLTCVCVCMRSGLQDVRMRPTKREPFESLTRPGKMTWAAWL